MIQLITEKHIEEYIKLRQEAIDHARTLAGVDCIHLSVSAQAITARHLYESMGFEVWGTEPDALRDGRRSTDEHHSCR